MARNKDRGREEQEQPAVGKKPTRDDLTKEAIEAAKQAAHGAEMAADAALASLDQQEPKLDVSDQEIAAAPVAFEAFMATLTDHLRRYADRVTVSDLESWIKIEGRQGHKVYIPKGKTAVTRVESTLDPDLIKGSTAISGNGRIACLIPATAKSVGEAIRLLATLDEPIRPPRVGQRNPH